MSKKNKIPYYTIHVVDPGLTFPRVFVVGAKSERKALKVVRKRLSKWERKRTISKVVKYPEVR